MSGFKPELQDIIDRATIQKWTITMTKKNHLIFKAPAGKGIVITGGTPGDHRALKNLKSRLKRLGYND